MFRRFGLAPALAGLGLILLAACGNEEDGGASSATGGTGAAGTGASGGTGGAGGGSTGGGGTGGGATGGAAGSAGAGGAAGAAGACGGSGPGGVSSACTTTWSDTWLSWHLQSFEAALTSQSGVSTPASVFPLRIHVFEPNGTKWVKVAVNGGSMLDHDLTETPTTWQLEPSVFKAAKTVDGMNYAITALSVQLDTQGKPLTVSGNITVTRDDLCATGPEGTGSFQASATADVTPPTFKLWPAAPHFPWDGLWVVGSEPGLVDDLSAALQLDATACGMKWDVDSDGRMTAHAVPKDWSALAGKTLSIPLLAGVRDLSCNASAAQTLSTTIVDPGPALAEHGLNAANTLYSWGGVKHLASGNPACEDGGCVEIDATWPSPVDTGAAGRVLAKVGAAS